MDDWNDLLQLLDQDAPDERILEYLDQNPDVLARTSKIGITPLHRAASYGRLTLVKKFIAKNPEPLSKKTSHSGRNLLHMAILGLKKTSQDTQDLEMIRYLAELEPRLVTECDYDGNPPLYLAIYRRRFDVVEYLMELYLPDLREMKRTPLHMAAGSGSGAMINFLCQRGYRHCLDSLDTEDSTPFHYAARSHNNNKEYAIEALFRLGARRTSSNSGCLFPIEEASLRGNNRAVDTFRALAMEDESADDPLEEDFVLEVRHRVYFSHSLTEVLLWELG